LPIEQNAARNFGPGVSSKVERPIQIRLLLPIGLSLSPDLGEWRIESALLQNTGRTVSDSTFKKPKYIAVVCGVCATRMTPPSKHAGRRVKCPDCETMCPIPTVEQLKERHRDEQLAEPA